MAVGLPFGDRRAGVGDGTTPGRLDRRRGVDPNFQRNQTIRRLTSRTMRAIALQNDKYPVNGAPSRRRRDGDVPQCPLEGNEDLALKSAQRAALILYRAAIETSRRRIVAASAASIGYQPSRRSGKARKFLARPLAQMPLHRG